MSQLLRPMPNAPRTKENQTLATPRYGSAVIFYTSAPENWLKLAHYSQHWGDVSNDMKKNHQKWEKIGLYV